MSIIKKYNQYIKETKKVNEDIEDIDQDIENDIDQEGETEDEEVDMPGEDEEPNEISDEEDEEEGYQYLGSKMLTELADKLGAKVINNSIEYNGKKINFFSETEMYHVDRKKFKTSDEVVDYLNSESGEQRDLSAEENEIHDNIDKGMVNQEEEIMSESKRHKSYRTTRKFESYRKIK